MVVRDLSLIRELEAQLRDAGIESPAAEARWIVEAVHGEPGEHALNTLQRRRLDDMLRRRIAGEPLQYVLGAWQFRGVELFVDPRVLIPRPETEITAQHAIDAARRLSTSDPERESRAGRVLVDLGTGSGAIALALADELQDMRPDLEIWATDASEDALAVARANLAGAGTIATCVRLVRGDWFEALPDDLRGRVKVVVSNPPYISETEVDDLPREVRDHEPYRALVSGPTGLEAIERIASEAPEWLASGGALIVELSPSQAQAAADLARDAGFTEIAVHQDLAGRDRVLLAWNP